MRGLLLVLPLLSLLANALPLDFLDGCQEGTHVAVMPSGERYCRWCEPGTYQAEESTKSEACTPCRRGMVSGEIGAKSASACRNCPPGGYAIGLASCAPCPLNTVSPGGAVGVVECTPLPGHYASGPAGTGATECPANYYCVEGTTAPTPCPEGTISPPGASVCTPGVRSIILYDWVFAAAWVALFSSGVLGLGMYRHLLKAPRLPTSIQIRITR
jgi:hypothetical protein